MALFNFHKKPQTDSCNCAGDACCTPKEDDANACCAPAEDAGDACCCCAEDDCCTTDEAGECCCTDDTCCSADEAEDCCCCGSAQEETHSIQVLGGGCKNCHKLMDHVQQAQQTLGMDIPVELVSDMAVIAGYGVMSTPALVVDGKVISTGRVLSPEQAADAIRTALGQ